MRLRLRGWRKFPITFYNLRVGRSIAQVTREIRALLKDRPAVLGLCEAVGYHLPQIPGYRLIRDTSRLGRANIAAYVRDDLPVTRLRWTDLKQTWKRPKHPGEHPARSYVTFRAGGVQVTVAHQPPRFTNNEIPAQTEGLDALEHTMSPRARESWAKKTPQQREAALARPRAAVLDANRTGRDSGPSPAVLARRIKGRLVPQNRIDVAVTAGELKVRNWSRPTIVHGVRLESDHPHALVLDTLVQKKWLTTEEQQ